MQSYSKEIRRDVLAACDAGEGTRAVALRFGCSESWVRRVKQERREQGKTAPATTRRIVGVFRQGAHETHRTVCVERLNPAATYEVRRAPEGTLVTNLTGKELEEKGFNVDLEKQYDGADFEIDEIK